MKNRTWLLIIGIIIVLSIINSFLPNKQETPFTGSIIKERQAEVGEELEAVEDLFLVTYVVDGDTIEIETGERVRLICIDTPERGQEGYSEAKEYLENLILDKKIRLVKDISETGKYGRLVRYVYLEDGTFVNELIVREGYAEAYWYKPDITLCPTIQQAEDYAKKNNLGIWEEDEVEETENYQEEEILLENYDCSSNVYNCADFLTYAEAQKVFEYCGGIDNDIHRLDGDEDGLACESLP